MQNPKFKSAAELRGYAERAAAVLRLPLCRQLASALMVDCLTRGHMQRLLPHSWRQAMAQTPIDQVRLPAVTKLVASCCSHHKSRDSLHSW